MKPIRFKEANKNLLPPSNFPAAAGTCEELWVCTDGIQCVSLWKMSVIERIKALIMGKIWLIVCSGVTQPPVCVLSDYPFLKTGERQ